MSRPSAVLASLAPLRAAVRPSARPLVAARSRLARPYSTETENKDGSCAAEAGASDEAAQKIAELEAKVKELNKEIQYARADYQTLARRANEEKLKERDFAISKFALSLLQTPDTLSTALRYVPQPVEPGTPLAELSGGVELTRKALLKTLAQHGITPFAPLGETFDPNLHEATFQVPAEVAPPRDDGKPREKGEIFEVGKDGWMIKDRVLRPAQVGVVMIE